MTRPAGEVIPAPWAGYRTAATPPPSVVTHFGARDPLERPWYALGVWLGLLGWLALGSPHDLGGLALAALLPLAVVAMLVDRSGRPSASIEHRPGSAHVELVTHEREGVEVRRVLALDEVVEVRVGDIQLDHHLRERTALLVIVMTDGRVEHGFGRPVRLYLADAERVRAQLQSLFAEARHPRAARSRDHGPHEDVVI